jgi:RHS repeat-associated protein
VFGLARRRRDSVQATASRDNSGRGRLLRVDAGVGGSHGDRWRVARSSGRVRSAVGAIVVLVVVSGMPLIPRSLQRIHPAAADVLGGLYERVVRADGPARYWPLQDTSGSTATDESGWSMGVISATGVTLGVDGPMPGGKAMHFDGADATGIDITETLEHPWGGIEAWVRTAAEDGTIYRSRPGQFELAVRDGLAYFGVWTEGWAPGDEPATADAEASGGQVDDGEWHHVAVSMNYGSSGFPTPILLYVDGQLVDVSAAEWWPVGGFGATAAIGRNGSVPSAAHPSFAGDLAHVAVYTQDLGYSPPLSPQRIRAHYVASGRVLPLDGGDLTAAELLGGGNPAEPCVCDGMGDLMRYTAYPVDASTGNFWHTFNGISAPGRGPSLNFTFTYNSMSAEIDGPLGFGFTHTYNMHTRTSGSTVAVVQENGAEVTFEEVSPGVFEAPPRVFATLTHNAGAYTFTRRAREIFEFDATTGRLTSIADLNGETTSITYSTSPDTMTVTAPGGRALTFESTAGKVTSVVDSSTPARVVEFDYGVDGDLEFVTDVGGGVWSFTYDDHQMVTLREPRYFGDTTTSPSPVITNVYGTDGRVASQTDQIGRATSFDYTSIADSVKVTDPMGNVTVDRYDAGLLVEKTRGWDTPEEAAWLFTYDPATAGITSVTDPNQNTAVTEYDALGNVVRQVDPLGRTTSWTYDPTLNVVTSMTPPARIGLFATPATTTWTYDTAGNLESVSAPLIDRELGSVEAVSETTYVHADGTHPGDVTSTIDPEGNTWTYGYNAAGDLEEVVAPATPENPTGNTTTYVTNDTGWVTEMVAPKGNLTGADPADYTTTFVHDEFGRVIETRDPLWDAGTPVAHRSVRTFDDNGNLGTTTDGEGNTTTYHYNAANEVVTVERADSSELGTEYWSDGTLKAQIDGAGERREYTYDPLGRLIETEDPLGRITRYGYDPGGRPIWREDPGGDCDASPRTGCTTSTFDAGDQLIELDYSESGTADVTFVYDDNGRRFGMIDGTGTSTRDYDSLGRVTSTTSGGYTTGFGWDLAGHNTSITYPGTIGTVTYGYDAAGRVEQITDWDDDDIDFAFDANSNPVGRALPNTTTSSYEFDAADQLMGIAEIKSATPFASFDYGRDGNGGVDAVTSTGVPADTHSYSYNDLNQLEDIDSSATAYGHDAADNLSRLFNGTGQAFDDANQLERSYSPVTHVGTTTVQATSGTPLSVMLPGGVQANDQLLIAAAVPDSITVSTPAGFTAVNQTTSGTGGVRVVVWRKAAVGGETSQAVTFPSGSYSRVLTAAVYRGVQPSAPIEASSVANTTSGTSLALPTVTPATGNGRLAAFTAAVGATGNWTPASGMTETADTSSSGSTVIQAAAADEALAAGGATGIRTATFASSRPLAGVLVALKPLTTTYAYNDKGERTGFITPTGVNITIGYDQAGRLTSYGPAGTYTYRGDGLRAAKTAGGITTPFTWNDATSGVPLLLVEHAAGGPVAYLYGPGGEVLEQKTTKQAINMVGTAAAGNSTSTQNVTLTLPAGIEAADMMIAVAALPSTKTINSAPTGWTLLSGMPVTNTDGTKLTAWRKSAEGGETSATFTFQSGTYPKAMAAIVYRGIDPSTPVDVFQAATATDNELTIPSVTPTGGGDQLLAMVAVTLDSVNGDFTPPEGMTERRERSASGTTVFIADAPIGTGATGDMTVTYSSTQPLAGLLLALKPAPGATSHYHHDQLGSVRAITNSTGSVVATYTYDPYGRLTGSTGIHTNPFRWAGEYTDTETGLVYLRARYYDPTTAQFLTRDPLESSTREPYAYVAGNPLNGVDPLGLCGWTDPWNCIDDAAEAVVETADDAWDATGGKVVTAANHFEWNACVNAGAFVTIGYCHNFVGLRPNGGRRQVGVGFTAWGSAVVGPGPYAEESISASYFNGWGGGIGRDVCNDSTYGFGGVGAGFSIGYSATPEMWEKRFPGIRQAARDILDWLGG